MTFDGDCRFRIIGSNQGRSRDEDISDWVVRGTSTGICTGSNFTNDPFIPGTKNPVWKLETGTNVIFRGCELSALSVAANATADIRSSECASIFGSGMVNRRSLTMCVGPTYRNENQVWFPVPFPDPVYSVSLQLTTTCDIAYGAAYDPDEFRSGVDQSQRGPPPPPPPLYPARVGARFNTGFLFNDPEGNNYFDITVIHD